MSDTEEYKRLLYIQSRNYSREAKLDRGSSVRELSRLQRDAEPRLVRDLSASDPRYVIEEMIPVTDHPDWDFIVVRDKITGGVIIPCVKSA